MTVAEKLESIRKEVALEHLIGLDCFKGANFFENIEEMYRDLPSDYYDIRHDHVMTQDYYDGIIGWHEYIYSLKNINIVREILCSEENAMLRYMYDED